MTMKFDRRSILRGAMAGGFVGMGIPALDMFLHGNGEAYADTGAKIAVRFGTYFWGLGLTPGRWVPKTVGKGFEITPELQSLGDLKDKISVFSGFRVHLDGKPNLQHWTGQGAVLSGLAPSKIGTFSAGTFDIDVARAIGGGTRFRSIELTPFGNPKLSYSTTTGTGFNTPETTPLKLYERLFGEGFQDPNSPDWKPDPSIMVRQSVLSAVTEQRKALMAQAGAADRTKLDQYFTSIRQMEEQLAVQLQRPARAEACFVPSPPSDSRPTGVIDKVNEANKQMAQLMAMALACNQTKVFNVVHTSATSEAYLPGDSKIYHLHTHDEPVDTKLGYQVTSSKLAELAFRGYGDFARALNEIKEGPGTLLDNTIMLGFSDTGYAKIHSTDNIPMFIAGGGGGRHKGGMHVVGNGDPVTRVSLTAQQLIGLPVGQFGIGGMETTKAVTEVIA
jgi:hypothetical protein